VNGARRPDASGFGAVEPGEVPRREAKRVLYVASANAGKLHEMRALFGAHEIGLAVDPGYVSPPEGDVSYADNAALKARALSERMRARGTAVPVIADDSGLEVFALDRRPGVLTADYGGSEASWPQRRAKLLAELGAAGPTDRRARFVCTLHYIGADGREFAALGTVDGEIAWAERGELGFSFDPIFLYPPAGKTFAELRDEQKNRVSHRAIAVAAIVAAIDAAALRLDVPGTPPRGTHQGEREYRAPGGT
jgi:XTP/dITP diphosphohydrolase